MHREINPTPDYAAAWIITLWRAIHGNDATNGDIAAHVIANLSRFLPACEASFGMQPLPSPPCTLHPGALECSEAADYSADAEPDREQLEQICNLQCFDPDDFSTHHYYFKFKGVFYCLDCPASACLPTAA